MSNFIKNPLSVKENGSAVAMVLAVASVVGVLATFIISSTSENTKNEIKMSASLEVASLNRKIYNTLINNIACKNTLSGNFNTIGSVSKIRDEKNIVAFDLAGLYGNNKSVKISKMKIDPLSKAHASTEPTGTSTAWERFNLEIEYEKLAKGLKGNRKITQIIPITVSIDAAHTIKDCYATDQNVIAETIQLLCGMISGTYNLISGACELTTFPSSADTVGFNSVDTNRFTGVSTQYVADFLTYINDRYVNVAGDTMTGPLGITSPSGFSGGNLITTNITLSTSVCVGTKCRTFAETKCPTGTVAKGVKTNGEVICENTVCPTGKYYSGLTTPQCTSFPSNTCAADKYVVKVESNGNVQCASLPGNTAVDCGNNKYLQGIKVDGTAICEPKMIDTNTNAFGKACASPLFLRGIKSSGAAYCTSGCSNCSPCGSTKSIPISCPTNLGSPRYGSQDCRTNGWATTQNPYCYCPCGTCGRSVAKGISCGLGSARNGTQQCRTYGWVVTANPWCYCPCGSCYATKNVLVGSGTSAYYQRQRCETYGWRNY